MGAKNNNNLFFTCSLIEYIGRLKKRTRCEIADALGQENIDRIYEYADVLHCEPMEKVAHEFVTECKIETGDFDNIIECRYRIPDYWDIGEVYERLIEDSYKDSDILNGIWEVYHSWTRKYQTITQIFITNHGIILQHAIRKEKYYRWA